MTKKLLGLSFILSVFLISCESDDIQNPSSEEKYFSVESNSSEFSKSISDDGVGVLGVTSVSDNRSMDIIDSDSEIGKITLEQIATIEPPVLDGKAMRANHVDIDGNYAYVAYTKEGPTYLGGIDIIDISDKYAPKVVSRMTTTYADVNALFYRNNKVFFTGALNTPASSGSERAFFGSMEAINGELASGYELNNFYGGQAGVDILPYQENNFIGVSGSESSIGYYSDGLIMEWAGLDYEDLRAAAHSNGKVVTLSGKGYVIIIDEYGIDRRITTKPLIPESKRTIEFLNDLLMVSEGPNGVGIYNLESGQEVNRLPINMLPDAEVAEGEKVTNAVTIFNDFILMANGGAGFGITKIDENYNVVEEGIIEIDGSANYVKAKGDYIFVASGTGGLRILKMSRHVAPETSFLACSDYSEYSGDKNLNINSGAVESYGGSVTLKHLNVGGILNFCGALNIEKSTNVNSFGEFNMSGALAVGQTNKNENLTVNSKSILRIEGSLTVYGDLNLNSGATLEFVGENSSIHIYGEVRKGQNVTISGNYTDTSNKL
ncbi:hypothetical protein [Autumnicola psychrophila]|uniref:LVIVD repeat-containing protein n=1 Tax=Autumnicola psychrophila TaxID=3075592 RepID=A0ABU3DNK1_9FLAO|nr:hypothetical protein [Zunongwangia sp. F225]MDT0685294.1 hypothetical protein [Zunongwangia sp. F225]